MPSKVTIGGVKETWDNLAHRQANVKPKAHTWFEAGCFPHEMFFIVMFMNIRMVLINETIFHRPQHTLKQWIT